MQKKRLLIIAVTFCVLFSLFRLCNLELYHSKEISAESLIRFRFLIGVHGLFLIAMIALFFVEQFYSCLIIAFLFCTIVTISFLYCEAVVRKTPGHSDEEDYLVFRQNKFKKQREKTYLSVYYITYLYSVIGSITIGLFLSIRYLIICYYQRQLMREFEAVVTPIPFNEELKGKQCIICIGDFVEESESFYQLNQCKHIFHTNCIKEWVHYSRTCPLCRASIFPQRRSSHQLSN